VTTPGSRGTKRARTLPELRLYARAHRAAYERDPVHEYHRWVTELGRDDADIVLWIIHATTDDPPDRAA
jgi:hypothetical protein